MSIVLLLLHEILIALPNVHLLCHGTAVRCYSMSNIGEQMSLLADKMMIYRNGG